MAPQSEIERNKGVAAALRDELAASGITVQTINPGAYDTGFNDRLADTTYHWHDDAVRATFAPTSRLC